MSKSGQYKSARSRGDDHKLASHDSFTSIVTPRKESVYSGNELTDQDHDLDSPTNSGTWKKRFKDTFNKRKKNKHASTPKTPFWKKNTKQDNTTDTSMQRDRNVSNAKAIGPTVFVPHILSEDDVKSNVSPDQDDDDGYHSAPDEPRHSSTNDHDDPARWQSDNLEAVDHDDNKSSDEELPSEVEEEIVRASMHKRTNTSGSPSIHSSNLKASAGTIASASAARSLSRSWHHVLDKDSSVVELRNSMQSEDQTINDSIATEPVPVQSMGDLINSTGLHSILLKATKAYPSQTNIAELFSKSRSLPQNEQGDIDRLQLVYRTLYANKKEYYCSCKVEDGEFQSKCTILLGKKLTNQGLSQQLLRMMSSVSIQVRSWTLRCASLVDSVLMRKSECLFIANSEIPAPRRSIFERVVGAHPAAAVPQLPELFPLCLSVIIEEGGLLAVEIFEVFFEDFLGISCFSNDDSKSNDSSSSLNNWSALSCALSQPFVKPELYPVIVNLLGLASEETVKTVMSAMFLLLSSNHSNMAWVLDQQDWMEWIIPMLIPPHRQVNVLPLSSPSQLDLADVLEDEDPIETKGEVDLKTTDEKRQPSDHHKLSFQIQVNLLSLIVHNLMKRKDCDITSLAKELTHKIDEYRPSGSNDICRILFYSVLRRITKQENNLQITTLDDPIIFNELEFLKTIRKFIFLPFLISIIDTPLYVSEECEIPDLILVVEVISFLKLRLSTKFYRMIASIQQGDESTTKRRVDQMIDEATSQLIFFQRVQRYVEVLVEEQALPEVEFESLAKSIAVEVCEQFLFRKIKKTSIFRTKSKLNSYKKSLLAFRHQFKLHKDVHKRQRRESRQKLEEVSDVIREFRTRTLHSEIAHQLVVNRTAEISAGDIDNKPVRYAPATKKNPVHRQLRRRSST
jgi:hypothetical protein